MKPCRAQLWQASGVLGLNPLPQQCRDATGEAPRVLSKQWWIEVSDGDQESSQPVIIYMVHQRSGHRCLRWILWPLCLSPHTETARTVVSTAD